MSAFKSLKTPVMDKRKLATKDTFSGRLDWKSKLYGMPATSTPKVHQPANDVVNCFGFDASSDEENYSALISPINSFDEPKDEVVIIKEIGGDTGFDALLHKYGKVDDDGDCELHIDASKIKRTYLSTRNKAEHKFVPVLPLIPKTKRRSLKKSKENTPVAPRRKKHPQREEEIDSETAKWCALKNKEFEDVLHVPLVVTRQPSTTLRRSVRTQKKK